MSLKTVTVLVALVAGVAVAAVSEQLLKTLNDHHDFDAVVADPAKLEEFTLCFIGEGPCTDLTQSYRNNMPEAVPTACKRCTEGQKHMFRTYLDGLERNAPELYKRYAAFYDPQGTFLGPLRAELVGF